MEAQWFDRCILDSSDDATGDTDLTLIRQSSTFRIALVGPTAAALDDRTYKRTYRNNGGTTECLTIQLPFERLKGPGNKRWYELADFQKLRPDGILIQSIGREEIRPDTEAILQRIDGMESTLKQGMGFLFKVLHDVLANQSTRRRAPKALPEPPTLWEGDDATINDADLSHRGPS